MKKSEIALNKKFLTLFWDSIEQIDTSFKVEQFTKGSLVRGSIVSSFLSVECAANICIAKLELPDDISNEIRNSTL